MGIAEEYIRLHPRSAQLYEEAKGLFPSGITHDIRYVPPFPIFVEKAERGRK